MNDLRRRSLLARREMSDTARAHASSIICSRVLNDRLYFAGNNLACYLAMNDEVDTTEIIERGWRANKRIFVPVLIERRRMAFREMLPETTLRKNFFDLWEPQSGEIISPRRLDMVIAPVVAYDANNNRIGMGSGYYDRCFSFLRCRQHWFRPKLVGLAFSCQKVEKISPNAWDIPLYKVISDAT